MIISMDELHLKKITRVGLDVKASCGMFVVRRKP